MHLIILSIIYKYIYFSVNWVAKFELIYRRYSIDCLVDISMTADIS